MQIKGRGGGNQKMLNFIHPCLEYLTCTWPNCTWRFGTNAFSTFTDLYKMLIKLVPFPFVQVVTKSFDTCQFLVLVVSMIDLHNWSIVLRIRCQAMPDRAKWIGWGVFLSRIRFYLSSYVIARGGSGEQVLSSSFLQLNLMIFII